MLEHELQTPADENRPVAEHPVRPRNDERNPPIVKGCFIATAAMGSALHPHVQLLRDFRDGILLQSRYRGIFERLLDRYYRLSPPIAAKMNESCLVKFALRYSLVYPIVFGIKGILPIVNLILGIERDARKREQVATLQMEHDSL